MTTSTGRSAPDPDAFRRALERSRTARENEARQLDRQMAVSENTLKLRFRL